MKRVLLIAYDFPPRGGSGVFRVAKFARYLPDWGWQPVVVTVDGEGPHPDHRLLAELPPGIEIERVARPGTRLDAPPIPASDTSAVASRGWRSRLKPWIVPDAQLGWVPGAWRAAERRLRRGDIDAVLTSGPPFSTHLVGLMLRRRHPALPWVMDMRDLWSDGFDQHLLIPYKLNRWLEQRCVRRADRVTVVTDSMARLIVDSLGAPPHKVVTITNGFDRHDFAPFVTERDDKRGGDRPLQLCYVGTITESQATGIESLFAAIENLHAEGITTATLRLELVGAFGASIHQRARPLTEVGLVTFKPFQAHREAIACMMDADVLLLVRPDDLDARIVHTSKVFEYMAVGRPILAIAPQGEITRLVADEHLGASVAPSDVAGIAGALRRMIGEHRDGTLVAQSPNLDQLDRYERRTLTGRLAHLLDDLSGAARADTTKGGV